MKETIFNITVIGINEDSVLCRVIETNENRIFKRDLFDFWVDSDDEFIVTIKEGSGFSEMTLTPNETKTSRIVVRKCIHKGQQLDCYVPQIRINGAWRNVLSKGSYILKDSFEPVTICKKCFGEGCNECQSRGFRKGMPIDLKHIAEFFLNEAIKELEKANEIINSYSKLNHNLTGRTVTNNLFKQ